jgi:hypothetical protein
MFRVVYLYLSGEPAPTGFVEGGRVSREEGSFQREHAFVKRGDNDRRHADLPAVRNSFGVDPHVARMADEVSPPEAGRLDPCSVMARPE